MQDEVAKNELFWPPDLVTGRIFLCSSSVVPHAIAAALVTIAVQRILVVIIPLAKISCARSVKQEHVNSTALQQPSTRLQEPPRQTKDAKQQSDPQNLTTAISPELYRVEQQLFTGL